MVLDLGLRRINQPATSVHSVVRLVDIINRVIPVVLVYSESQFHTKLLKLAVVYTARNFMVYMGHLELLWQWNLGGFSVLSMWLGQGIKKSTCNFGGGTARKIKTRETEGDIQMDVREMNFKSVKQMEMGHFRFDCFILRKYLI